MRGCWTYDLRNVIDYGILRVQIEIDHRYDCAYSTIDLALSSSKGAFHRQKGLAVEIGGTRRPDAVWSCWWIPVSRRLQLIDTARDGSTS